MGKVAGLLVVVVLAGCASTPIESPPIGDEARPLVTIECFKRPNALPDEPFERCKFLSASPDTPATRLRADRTMGRLRTARHRSPSEDLIGGETVFITIHLGPEGQSDDDYG